MSVKADFNLHIQGRETLSSGKEIVHQISDGANGSYTSTSTVPVTVAFSETRTLVSATYTYDLAALPDGQNWTGLKVQLVAIRNRAASAGPIILDCATATVADNYELTGAGSVTVHEGGRILMANVEGAPDVAATNKDFDIQTTVGSCTWDIVLIAG